MENSYKENRRNIALLLHIIFWVVIGGSHYLVFDFVFNSDMLLPRTLTNMAALAFIYYFNTEILVNKILEQKYYFTYGVAAVLLVLVFIPIRTWLNMQFPIPTHGLVIQDPERGFQITAFASNLGVVLFSTLYQVMVNRVADERRALQAINEHNEAQLQLLRAQINPHFLFNTLNNIYSLAVTGSEKTADMVLKLSGLLRYVIYESQAEKVPLLKELNQLEEFIELFQMKSENPLNIFFEKKGTDMAAEIEPMILIPLVENCFKHCDFESNENAFVKIYAHIKDGQLLFKTINSKNDNDTQKDKVGGVGLENIKRRLELKQHQDWKFETKDNGDVFETICVLNLK